MKTSLELLIDEAIPGHFYWTILWRGELGDLPRVIGSAPGPMPTRDAATTRGLAALSAMREADEADKALDSVPARGRADPNADTVNGSL